MHKANLGNEIAVFFAVAGVDCAVAEGIGAATANFPHDHEVAQ